MQTSTDADGPWAGGWMAAAVAGLMAAVLARALGDVAIGTAMIIGIFVFLVFGVLLGSGGVELSQAHEDHDHGHYSGHHKVKVPAHPTLAVPVTMLEPAIAVPLSGEAEMALPELVPPMISGTPPGARQPAGLAAPRGGHADDLKVIEGIGPAMEQLCNDMGFFHYDQIAGWSAAEVAWVDQNLKGFKGRATRDKWVAQAKLIGAVGVPEFLRRAKTNDY